MLLLGFCSVFCPPRLLAAGDGSSDQALLNEWQWKGECRDLSTRKSRAEVQAKQPAKEIQKAASCASLARRLGLVKYEIASLSVLVPLRLKHGSLKRAWKEARRAQALINKLPPYEASWRYSALFVYGLALKKKGRFKEAVKPLGEAYEGLRQQVGGNHLEWRAGGHLAGAWLALKRYDRALPVFERIYQQHQVVYGDGRATAMAAYSLGMTFVALKRYSKGASVLAQADRIMQQKTDVDDVQRYRYRLGYALCLGQKGDVDASTGLLAQAFDAARQHLPRERELVELLGTALVSGLIKAGKRAEAQRRASQLQDWVGR